MFLLPFFVQIVFKLLEGLELIPQGGITSKSDIWGVPERRGCHGGHSTRSCGESEDEAGGAGAHLQYQCSGGRGRQRLNSRPAWLMQGVLVIPGLCSETLSQRKV